MNIADEIVSQLFAKGMALGGFGSEEAGHIQVKQTSSHAIVTVGGHAFEELLVIKQELEEKVSAEIFLSQDGVITIKKPYSRKSGSPLKSV